MNSDGVKRGKHESIRKTLGQLGYKPMEKLPEYLLDALTTKLLGPLGSKVEE